MVNKYITSVWKSESTRRVEVQGNPRLCREFHASQGGYRMRKFLIKGIAHDGASKFNHVKW